MGPLDLLTSPWNTRPRMADDVTEGLSDSTPTDAESVTGAIPEAPPAWFAEVSDKISGRLSTLGKDLGRLRERIPKPVSGTNGTASPAAPAAPTSKATAPEFSQEWQQQFRELTRREAGLSSEQLAWRDESTEGMEIPARARVLDAYLAGLSANGKQSRPTQTATGGRAATAATRSSVAHPTSRREYIGLHRSARECDKQAERTLALLEADPTFTAEF